MLLINGHEVLREEVRITNSGATQVERFHHCLLKNITVTSNKQPSVNEEVLINIKYQTFDILSEQYITDEITKLVDIKINGSIQGQLDIINGLGSFEFESAISGTFVIEIEGAVCEVIVV